MSHGWLLGKHFIPSKGIFWLKQKLKEPFSAQPRDMGIYPIAISQSERDKFP